jgi:hypothetical protein
MPKLLMAMSAQTSRAAVLRETLHSSEQLVKELSQVLTSYSHHLEELVESVEVVATRSQVIEGFKLYLPISYKMCCRFRSSFAGEGGANMTPCNIYAYYGSFERIFLERHP